MEIIAGVPAVSDQHQLTPPPIKADRLNSAVQQQLNIESVKSRALGLSKTISRILEDFNTISITNANPKWQDILGQFSMVNMELFNIVEDIKKVSKAFVVHPKNVNGENAVILPVMLSSKLLPEMEAEDNDKKEQLLSGLANFPITMQMEKLKARIDVIGTACETAEKIIADSRKAFGLGSRQGPTLVPTLDKVQAAKIQDQENELRAAVNFGEGLRINGNQRNIPSSLPPHLMDALTSGDGTHSFGEAGGAFPKNAATFLSNTVNPQGGLMQPTGGQMIGRSVPSPSGISGPTSFDNASTPPIPYANSPRSGGNIMNTPSPQQQTQQQQQRQKMMQMPQHQQQLLIQQQLRQPTNAAVLGQGTVSQIQDLQGQTQQKFQQVSGQHQMQYSQSLSQQQFQTRQLQSSAHIQQNITQNQMAQGNQLRNQLSQFTGTANNALFNAAQTSPNSQMITNMSTTMQPQSLMPRMQFGLSGGHPQRNLQSQILNDQMFGMGASNSAGMVGMQSQQQQGGFGSIPSNSQTMQPSISGLPSNQNFQQQKPQNQQ